jgi:hypothetical protein
MSRSRSSAIDVCSTEEFGLNDEEGTTDKLVFCPCQNKTSVGGVVKDIHLEYSSLKASGLFAMTGIVCKEILIAELSLCNPPESIIRKSSTQRRTPPSEYAEKLRAKSEIIGVTVPIKRTLV